MEITTGLTGVEASPSFKVEKPISTLIITKNDTYASFTNEEIKVFIESNDGSNVDIVKAGIKLKPLALLSQLGEGALQDGATSQVYVKLSAAGNALSLTNNQKVMVELKGLDITKSYSIDGFELPVAAPACLEFERKLIMAGDTTKELDVREYNAIVIENRDKVTKLEITYNNGITCKYGPREIRHMLAAVNDLAVSSNTAANLVFGTDNFIALSLVNATRLTIETDGTETEVILSKIKTY